jgi:hypothetical protein
LNSDHASFRTSFQGYEKALADIVVKNPEPSKIPLFGEGPGFGLAPEGA